VLLLRLFAIVSCLKTFFLSCGVLVTSTAAEQLTLEKNRRKKNSIFALFADSKKGKTEMKKKKKH
jgi:hypothetical protein